MEEKIQQLIDEKFEYDSPQLIIEKKEFEAEVDSGEEGTLSFEIMNDRGIYFDAKIISYNQFIYSEQTELSGKKITVKLKADCRNIMPGKTLNGLVKILSNCGSLLVKIRIDVTVPACEFSNGKLKDLFSFTNLAGTNMKEAVKLFKSDYFERFFLEADTANVALYNGLRAGNNAKLELEEFLISMHKKIPLTIKSEKNEINIQYPEDKTRDIITFRKDTWGYSSYVVDSSSEFVKADVRHFSSEDFVGDTYKLGITYTYENMRQGNNFAVVSIHNAIETKEIKIKVENYDTALRDDVLYGIKKQRAYAESINLYIDYYIGKITLKSYTFNMHRIFASMDSLGTNMFYKLLRLYINTLNHVKGYLDDAIESYEKQIDDIYEKDILGYCFYNCLIISSQDDRQKKLIAAQNLIDCYKSERGSWDVLCMIVMSDVDFLTPQEVLSRLISEISDGVNSPFIYLSVCKIINKAPQLLNELYGEMLECLHWGCRNGYLQKETIERYIYFAKGFMNYSDIIFMDMCTIYEKYGNIDALSAVCIMLVRGHKTSEEYNKWYSLGVDNNLKITNLYEYYLYSIADIENIQLPQTVVSYFMYNSNINVAKKATLYAYIVKNKAKQPKIYESYKHTIFKYMLSELSEGRINRNLAIIYEEFINEELITDVTAPMVASVMFSYEIQCYNPNIVGVYIRQRQLDDEEFVPVVQGKAIVHIFSEHAIIILTDAAGNRYVNSAEYTLYKLLHVDNLAKDCYRYVKDDEALLINLYEKADSMHQTGSEITELKKSCFEIPTLSLAFKKKVYASLIRYYYDDFEPDALDEMLKNLDWKLVQSQDIAQFIDYCAIRHFNDKALEGVFKYGFDKLDAKRLLMVSSSVYLENMNRGDTSLVKLAYYMFEKGKFDKNTLRYLCRYYIGGFYEMTIIYKTAMDMEINSEGICEKILKAVMLTGEMSPEVYEIFWNYSNDKRVDENVVKAFLNMNAYCYLIKGWILPEELFEYIKNNALNNNSRVCTIARLKHLSTKNKLDDEEKEFVEYNVNKLYNDNIYFTFFKKFADKAELPVEIQDCQFIEYIASPEDKVSIHYSIVTHYNSSKYETEVMRDVYEGIRVKKVILFHDELMQYYISQTDKTTNTEVITESVSVRFDEEMDTSIQENGFHMINTMLVALEMQDDMTFMQLLDEYVYKKSIVDIFEKYR